MKKNLVRIVALLLVAMLALTLLPMGALASEVHKFYTEDDKLEFYDEFPVPENGYYIGSNPIKNYGESKVTIKTSDYDNLIPIDDDLYEIDGLHKVSLDIDDGEWDVSDAKQSFTIPKVPTHNPDAMKEWIEEYGFWFYLSYVPHSHDLSYWYSDGTTHWRECLECGEDFMYQNWCTDGDEDGICNVCGGDVPYHDVTVIEEEGGKITVNKETASHRTKITADVEPAEGYKLKKLHFTKIRDDGSEQEITRYKKNGQFWTYMPTYDLEVSAEFVKK